MRTMYHLAVLLQLFGIPCVSFINGKVLVNEMGMEDEKGGNQREGMSEPQDVRTSMQAEPPVEVQISTLNANSTSLVTSTAGFTSSTAQQINSVTNASIVASQSAPKDDITIRYTIRNNLATPKFDFEQKVTSKAGQPFIRFMEQAADNDKNFQFSSTYYAKLGYLIEMLGTNRTNVFGLASWQFLKAPSIVLDVGVSSYIPKDGDHLILDYVLKENGRTCNPTSL